MKPRNQNSAPPSQPEAPQEAQSPFVFTNPDGEQLSAKEASERLCSLKDAAGEGKLELDNEQLTWFVGTTYTSPSAAESKEDPNNSLEIAQSSLLREEKPAHHTITGVSRDEKGNIQFDVAAVLPELREKRNSRLTHNPSLSGHFAWPLGPRIGNEAREKISLANFAGIVYGFVHPETVPEGASVRKRLGEKALGGASSIEESRAFLSDLDGEEDKNATYYVPPALLKERSTTTTNNASFGKKDKLTTATFSEANRSLFAVPKGLTPRAQMDPDTVARIKVADAYAAADKRKNATPDPEEHEDEEPLLSYEAAYVSTIQGLREHGKDAQVRDGFDALGSRNDSLKNLIMADLMDLSLVDHEGNVVVSDEDLRKDQEKELKSALKHGEDIAGARFTTKSGATVEIDHQYQDAQGTVLYDFAINTSDGLKIAQTREQMTTALELDTPDQGAGETNPVSTKSGEAQTSQMSDSEYRQRYIGVLRELRAALALPSMREEGVRLDPTDLKANFANDTERIQEAYKALVEAGLVQKETSKLTATDETILDEQVAAAIDLLEHGGSYMTPDGSEIKIIDLQAGEIESIDSRGVKSTWKNVTPEQLAEFLKKN